jgi:predicted unusual protein kinase regulating ubiquinone biosynthesis (AarF/ABC1/UbiB family)
MILIVASLFFLNFKVSADPEADEMVEQLMNSLERGVEEIVNQLPLSNETEKNTLEDFLLKYKKTITDIIRSKTTAAEKRTQIHHFIESLESGLLTKFRKIGIELADVNVDQIRSLASNSPNVKKYISVETVSWIMDAVGLIKKYSSDDADLVKRVSLITTVLKDITDIWGTSFFNALSVDPRERELGLATLTDDFYYFRREAGAFMGILKIIKDSNNLKNLKPEHYNQFAGYVQDLGLLYIKFAQSLSNVAIPVMKGLVKLEEIKLKQLGEQGPQSKNSGLSESIVQFQSAITKLQEFQDGLPPISAAYAESVLKAELGTATSKKRELLEKIIKHIDFNKPLKSGTIATTYQVNVPVTTNWIVTKTTRVDSYIIKIIRPTLENEINHGNKTFKTFLTLTSAFFPSFLQWVPRLLTSSFDSLSESFKDEISPPNEVKNQRKFRILLALSSVKVPAVNYVGERMLVMEAVTQSVNFDAFIEREADSKYMDFVARLKEIRGTYYEDDKKEKALAQLYQEHPIEKEKLDMFLRIYGEFLEATTYMGLAMSNIHGDLHPGNILIENVQGKQKLWFIDFGNVVDISGMISDPFFIASYMALGNSKEIAHHIYNLRDPKCSITENEVYEVIKAVMVKNNLDAEGKTIKGKILEVVMQLIGDKKSKPTQSSMGSPNTSAQTEKSVEEAAADNSKILSEVFEGLMVKRDYVFSGKYFQFVRTALPVGATIGKIINVIPTSDAVKQFLKYSNKGLFFGYIKQMLLKHPAQLRPLYDQLVSGLAEREKKAAWATFNEAQRFDQSFTYEFSTGRCEDLVRVAE